MILKGAIKRRFRSFLNDFLSDIRCKAGIDEHEAKELAVNTVHKYSTTV